jgi:predicted secreted hydrolase
LTVRLLERLQPAPVQTRLRRDLQSRLEEWWRLRFLWAAQRRRRLPFQCARFRAALQVRSRHFHCALPLPDSMVVVQRV